MRLIWFLLVDQKIVHCQLIHQNPLAKCITQKNLSQDHHHHF